MVMHGVVMQDFALLFVDLKEVLTCPFFQPI